MKARLPYLLVAAVVTAAFLLGLFEPSERRWTDLRMWLLERDAGRGAALVAIDASSLGELDTWPWPRHYHARVLDNLLAAGASRVAFAIDFSSRSTAGEDAAFERSLTAAGERAVLPVFQQYDRSDGQVTLRRTLPLERFGRHTALASINVEPEGDGRVRRLQRSYDWDGTSVPTLAAWLAGSGAGSGGPFHIDYGIAPASLTRLSFARVLRGQFDAQLVAGRQVIVGATAAELGDHLATPLHRALPGAVIHYLGYESLVQNRALGRLDGLSVSIGIFALALLGYLFAGWSWRRGLMVLTAQTALLGLAAVAAQALAPVIVDTLPWAVTLALCYLLSTLLASERQALRIFSQSMALVHQRRLMRSVQEASYHAILVVDSGARVRLFNPAAEKLFGRPANEVIGSPVGLLLPELERPEFTAETLGYLRQGLGADGRGRPREVAGREGSGRSFPMEMVVQEVGQRISAHQLERRGDDRNVFICMMQDIRARKARETERQTALDTAVSANIAKSKFLSGMSHELRTPLNAIIGFADVLRGGHVGELLDKQREYLDIIQLSGRHLLELINDILDLSKIEADEVALVEEEVDLAEMAEIALRLVDNGGSVAGLELGMVAADDLPWLRADQRMMRQVLLNLLSNTVKFTPAGGSITLRLALGPGGGLTVSVSDTGIGMSDVDIDAALTAYGRAADPTVRRIEGTGLGLPVTKAIIARHDGRMAIDSQPGRGTTVTCWLPPERLVAKVAGETVVS
jgi:PAS domain S-box-containing protein